MAAATVAARPRSPAFASFGFPAWALPALAMTAYALLPEVRRVLEWRSGVFGVSVLSAVPLAVLLIAAGPLLYGKRLARVAPALRWLAWIWFGGFSYAFVVALLQGNRFSAVYALADFCLPAVMGLWMSTLDEPVESTYERLARYALWLATPIALYGIVQFAILPPWDRSWMLDVRMPSIGPASPFQFRIFSTLNSPGPLGDFLTAVLLFNLPRLRRPTLLQMAQIGLCVAALGLSLVRSDWLALAAGILCFLWFSPDRIRNLAMLGVAAALCAALFANAALFLGNGEAQAVLSNRWDSLSALNTDSSYVDRATYFGDALTHAIDNPEGAGLGVFGTAAQIGANGQTVVFDNGYIARFTELGYFGAAAYIATLLGAVALAIRVRRVALAAGERRLAAIACASLALQVALLGLDLSSDHHNGFNGFFFWVPLGLLFSGASRR